MKVLVIPAFAIVALFAWWRRRDARLGEPVELPVVQPLARAASDRIVIAWRRAGVI